MKRFLGKLIGAKEPTPSEPKPLQAPERDEDNLGTINYQLLVDCLNHPQFSLEEKRQKIAELCGSDEPQALDDNIRMILMQPYKLGDAFVLFCLNSGLPIRTTLEVLKKSSDFVSKFKGRLPLSTTIPLLEAASNFPNSQRVLIELSDLESINIEKHFIKLIAAVNDPRVMAWLFNSKLKGILRIVLK